MAPITKKRRRVKIDRDVIRTEPDHRRASDGDGDGDDFESAMENQAEHASGISYNSISHRSSKRLKTSENLSTFPFMQLPPEVRNMIYHYLVVSQQQDGINLTKPTAKAVAYGKIKTGILFANRQTFHEASSVLYGVNKFVADISPRGQPIDFRVDTPGSALVGGKSLRNGRQVDMIKHTGRIYPKVLANVLNFELRIALFDSRRMCLHFKRFCVDSTSMILRSLIPVITTFCKANSAIGPSGKREMVRNPARWLIRINNGGGLTLWEMRLALAPLFESRKFGMMVENENAKIELHGCYPKGWKRVFHKFRKYKNGLVVDSNITRDMTEGCESRLAPWEDPDFLEPDFFDAEGQFLLSLYSDLFPDETSSISDSSFSSEDENDLEMSNPTATAASTFSNPEVT